MINGINEDVYNYVNQELDKIEKEFNVHILYAVESGSRGWVFANEDSDYDVRFYYIRPLYDYLSIDKKRDVIDINDLGRREYEYDLDLSGWDITKVLQLHRQSNPNLREHMLHNMVYRGNCDFLNDLPDFDINTLKHAYGSMTYNNYMKYIKGAHTDDFSPRVVKTYSIIDGMFYDVGIDSNHKTTSTTQSTGSWYNGSGNLTVEYSGNGTIVTHGDDNTTTRHLFYNDPSISTVKLSGMNTILNNSAIEFDITAFTGTPQIYFTDGTNNRTLNISSNGHYKIVFDGSVIKQYIDNVEVPLNNYAMTGDNIRFSFILNAKDESFTFKNLVIYPI